MLFVCDMITEMPLNNPLQSKQKEKNTL